MKFRKLVILFMFLGCKLFAQPSCVYDLKGDSVNISALSLQKPLVLVYYSDKSCYDCFDVVNSYFENDSTKQVLFVIEKTSSPLLNFEIRKKLMKKGIAGNRIYFSLDVTHAISPYIDLIGEKSRSRVPYKTIFDDSKEFVISDKFKSLVREFYPERRD